jgi:hypothetical protein
VAVEAHVVGGRKEYVEAGAARPTVAHLEPAAMRQYDCAANCQTEPVTRARALTASEWLEDALEILGGNTGAFVLDGELQFTLGGEIDGDANRGTWRRVLDRILDQICQHARHLTGLHPNRREVGWQVELE